MEEQKKFLFIHYYRIHWFNLCGYIVQQFSVGVLAFCLLREIYAILLFLQKLWLHGETLENIFLVFLGFQGDQRDGF